MGRVVRGVNVDALPPQFQGCVQGRTLIIDGDGPAYSISATVKRLDTALRRFQQEVLSLIFLTRAEDAIVHFTASKSHKAGRFQIKAVKPYQGQRSGKSKPPLLEPLRQAAALEENWLPEFRVVMNHILEADDAMMQDAYRLKENGIIWSDDKDLRMTPYLYWDRKTNTLQQSEPFGWLKMEYTPAGNPKLIGRGPLFFWAQMLMGDTADFIQGILRYNGRLCGPAAAYDILRNCADESEAANIVLSGYREIDQNPLPEGWLLWLLRWPGDNFWDYATSLNLTEENRSYLDECRSRDWFDAGT